MRIRKDRYPKVHAYDQSKIAKVRRGSFRCCIDAHLRCQVLAPPPAASVLMTLVIRERIVRALSLKAFAFHHRFWELRYPHCPAIRNFARAVRDSANAMSRWVRRLNASVTCRSNGSSISQDVLPVSSHTRSWLQNSLRFRIRSSSEPRTGDSPSLQCFPIGFTSRESGHGQP